MKNKFLAFILALMTVVGCGSGGGGDDTPSIFDGTYVGKLKGVNCENQEIELSVQYFVDAKSEDSGSRVILIDADNNVYKGETILTANSVAQIWGFGVYYTGDNKTVDIPEGVFFNIANLPVGQAGVSASYTFSDNPECSYLLEGVLDKK